MSLILEGGRTSLPPCRPEVADAPKPLWRRRERSDEGLRICFENSKVARADPSPPLSLKLRRTGRSELALSWRASLEQTEQILRFAQDDREESEGMTDTTAGSRKFACRRRSERPDGLDRRLQVLAALEEVGPGIRFLEPRFEVAEVEVGGLERWADFGPVEGGRDGGTRGMAHTEGRDDRLGETVAEGIEIDASLARRDAPFHRQLLRIGSGEARAELVGEAAHIVGVGADADRNEDVETFLAGGLREGHETEGVQCFLDFQTGLRRVGELPGIRIEIETDPVGLARIGGARAPDVHRDAAEVDQCELRLEPASENVVGRPLLVLDSLRRRVGRHPRGLLLLDEALALHPVGTSLQREQAVLHVGFQIRKDHVVEPRQIEFRVSLLGPEDLGRVGQMDSRFWILDFGFWIRGLLPLPPGEGQGEGGTGAGLLLFHFSPPGRMTSAGFLSSRRPRYTGWRSRWSAVHSWKEICATSRGSTQAAPFSRGGFLTGGVLTTRGRSFACREFKVLWSNPVPTFPT